MRSIIRGSKGELKLNGATTRAIAVLAALGRSGVPLRVPDICDGMLEFGVLAVGRNEKTEVSGILQRLIECGAVYHPDVKSSTVLYCLSHNTTITTEF